MKLRKYQLDAVDELLKSPRGGAEMVTGSGKSITMAWLIYKLQVRTLVIVPNLELKKQLSDTFLSIFGSLDNVTVENIDSRKLQTLSGYDALIIDECHHSAATTYQKLNKTAWSSIYYRYFFSGTMYRNNDDEQMLFEGITGGPRYSLTFEQGIAYGAIVPVDGYYLVSPPIENDYYTWPEVYSNLVVNNQGRNELIAVTMLKLQKLGPVLCLVKEVKHGKILSEMSGVPFVSGQDQDSRYLIKEFIEGRIKSLIGTYGVLAEGVDTKPAEWVIIAGLGKAKSAFQQQVGRAIRIHDEKDSAKIVLIKDVSHKFCRKHFSLQKKYLLALYGATMQELQIGGSGE